MIVHELFPTSVAEFQLGREITSRELEFVLGQTRCDNYGNKTSENTSILDADVLADLRQFMQTSVAEYLAGVCGVSEGASLRITQSWGNYTQTGQWHHKHAHANSFLSGVLYLQQASCEDKIYFYDDRYHQISITPSVWTRHNSESWWFEASVGKLLIFPSRLQHMVETVSGDGLRVSISFNTFPVGRLGTASQLTEVVL